MKMNKNSITNHDIFISYRRESGVHLASLIKQYLISKGYSTFMDIEDLKSGKFNEALLTKIEKAKDFIVVLTKDCLERCKNEDDWLRKEITHALKNEKNVIPILAAGFQMPQKKEELPSDINKLLDYHYLESHIDLFEESMAKLESKFLKSKPKREHFFEFDKKIIRYIIYLTVFFILPLFLFTKYSNDIEQLYQKAKIFLNVTDSKNNDWTLFVSNEGGFSILVPKTPTKTITKGITTYQINVDKTTTYFVNFYEFNEIPADALSKIDTIASGYLESAVRSGGTLRQQRLIELHGYPGNELVIDFTNGITMRQRFYIAGKKGYFLTVRGMKKDEFSLSKGFEKFLESFKLTTEINLKLDSVYQSIREQHRIYLRVNTLTGAERTEAANALVFGYKKLESDLLFFKNNAPENDPRKDTIQRLLDFFEQKGNE